MARSASRALARVYKGSVWDAPLQREFWLQQRVGDRWVDIENYRTTNLIDAKRQVQRAAEGSGAVLRVLSRLVYPPQELIGWPIIRRTCPVCRNEITVHETLTFVHHGVLASRTFEHGRWVRTSVPCRGSGWAVPS